MGTRSSASWKPSNRGRQSVVNGLPFMTRLAIALSPSLRIHVAKGVTKDVPLSKVINIGKAKLERTLRKEHTRKEEARRG
jgi:hypothetical protein